MRKKTINWVLCNRFWSSTNNIESNSENITMHFIDKSWVVIMNKMFNGL